MDEYSSYNYNIVVIKEFSVTIVYIGKEFESIRDEFESPH